MKVHRLSRHGWYLAAIALTTGVIAFLSSMAHAQGLVEYALILVLVAVVVIVILTLLGPAIGKVFCAVVASLGVTQEGLDFDMRSILPTPVVPAIMRFYQPVAPTLAAVSSNTPGPRRADNFSGMSDPIDEVVWWGVNNTNGEYCNKTAHNFILEFYQDGPIPGALVAHIEIVPVVEVERPLLDAMGDPLAVLYRYRATWDDEVPLSSGWLSIQSTGDEDCLWSWSLAATIDGVSAWQNPPFDIPQSIADACNSHYCRVDEGSNVDHPNPKRFGNACYLVSSADRTFDQHEADAQSWDSEFHLTSIHSVAEKDFVRGLVEGDVWIGLTDRDVEGTFVNLDGSPFDFDFWGEGQPDNLEDEDATVMGPNGAWTDESLTDLAAGVYKAGFAGWVPNTQYDFAFALGGAGVTPVQLPPATDDAENVTREMEPAGGGQAAVERDGISDIAQAVWLMKIVNGSSQLYPPDQARVIGRAGGGGFLGNEAILKDPVFIADLAATFADFYGVTPLVAEWAANAILDLLVYSISIDHLYWIERFKGTELEPLFDAIDAVNTLNSDAGMVLGGQADADRDGIPNSKEWSDSIASGLFEEELVSLFITKAEQVEAVFADSYEDEPMFPDLTVIDAAVSKVALSVSEVFTFSANVLNIGHAPSADATLRFYLTNATYVTPDDLELGNQPVPGLAGGQNSEQDQPIVAPESVGSYWVGACVDLLPEESESYNQCSSAVEIQVIGPDLTITGAGVSNNPLQPGQGFTVSATATNLSAAGSPAGSTNYYRSIDSDIGMDDTFLGSSAIPSLAAGASAAQSLPVSAPATSGTYWVGACAEPLPSESNTGNQCSNGVSIDVLGPDLTIGNPGVSDAYLEPSESFTIYTTATNLSTVASTSTTTSFYRSTDEIINSSDTFLGTSSLPALAGGAGTPQSLAVSAPATSGNYYVGACADPVPNELITDNQCSEGRVITIERPDLIVINPSVPGGTIVPNLLISISATAKNDGAATSSATTLQFYYSADTTISTFDFPVGTAVDVGALAPGEESIKSIIINAPSSAGLTYLGACIAAVVNETATSNQCSVAAVLLVN